MYSLLAQGPRFAALAAAVIITLYGNPWLAIPAWLMAAAGLGCPRVR